MMIMWAILGISDGAVVGLVTTGAALTAGFGAWVVVGMGRQAVETAKLGGSNEALAAIVERMSQDIHETKEDVRQIDTRLRNHLERAANGR